MKQMTMLKLFQNAGVRENSHITTWKPIDVKELKVFLGLLFHTSIIKASRKRAPLFNVGFGAYMSHNRLFLIIWGVFTKIRGPNNKPDDWLYKIRPVNDHFNKRNKLCTCVCICEHNVVWQIIFYSIY